LKLVVVQRGRLRDRQIEALRDEYLKRFRRYGTLNVVETERDGEAFWPKSARWKVLMDERGDQPTSEELSKLLREWTMRHGEVAFAVGGAHGHGEATARLANARLSLGRLTLPHQLAHLVLVEQLYRAASILAGSPYHHGG
jgi:23S rRNA (pseudouridine1915-N3)-methyltransferase